MAITQAPKIWKITTPAGCLPSAPSLDGENLFAEIVDYSKASSEPSNQGSLPSMCIEPLFQGLDLRHQGDKAKNNSVLILTPQKMR